MRRMMILCLLITAPSAFAGEFLKCKMHSTSYVNITASFKVDMQIVGISEPEINNEDNGVFYGEKTVSLSWSETECEDSSSITLPAEDYQNLRNGKMAQAWVDHMGPDANLSGYVDCVMSKR